MRMTREEAIEFGNKWLQINKYWKGNSTYAFFQIAIEAIEQETVLKERYDHEHVLRNIFETETNKLRRQLKEQTVKTESILDKKREV